MFLTVKVSLFLPVWTSKSKFRQKEPFFDKDSQMTKSKCECFVIIGHWERYVIISTEI